MYVPVFVTPINILCKALKNKRLKPLTAAIPSQTFFFGGGGAPITSSLTLVPILAHRQIIFNVHQASMVHGDGTKYE